MSFLLLLWASGISELQEVLGGGALFRDWVESLEVIYSKGNQGIWFSYTLFSTRRFFLSFVIWFMRWLICHNRKLGKMFSAPSHAVKGRGYDLVWLCCRCAGRKKFESSPVLSDMGQWRTWRSWRKWKDFLGFQGLFFFRVGGWRGAGAQVSIEHDGSNILENKQETHTLSFSLLHVE